MRCWQPAPGRLGRRLPACTPARAVPALLLLLLPSLSCTAAFLCVLVNGSRVLLPQGLFENISCLPAELPTVIYNDELDWPTLQQQISAGRFHNIVISPGPGTPSRPGDIGEERALGARQKMEVGSLFCSRYLTSPTIAPYTGD